MPQNILETTVMLQKSREIVALPSSRSHTMRTFGCLHTSGVLVALATVLGCGGSGSEASPGGGTEDTGGTAPSTDTGTASSGDTGVTDDAGMMDTGTITPKGTIDFIDHSPPIKLSADGKIAAIEDTTEKDVPLYFYDTTTKKLEQKTTIGDPTMNAATAVSLNGRVSALHGNPEKSAVWSESAGWLDFDNGDPKCDSFSGGAFDISPDGKLVVGINWKGCQAQAFVWTDSSGTGVMKILQTLGVGAPGKQPSNRSTVISRDGTTVGGFANNGSGARKPAIWNVADGTGFLLDPMNTDGDNSEVLSISADGKIAAGIEAYKGWVWTKEKGFVSMGELADQPKYSPTYPMALVAGGKLIFGKNGTALDDSEVAMVWTEAKGMRPLADVLKANGIVVPVTMRLLHALSASDDGSVVLGVAIDEKGLHKSYVLHLSADAYFE